MTDSITFGRTIRHLRVPDAVLTETIHAAGMELPRHEHASANVNFVLQGEFGGRVQREEYRCRAGSVLVKPGGVAHSDRYGAVATHGLIVEIPLDPLAAPDRAAGGLEDVWYSEAAAVAGVGWRLYRELLQPDSATPLMVQNLVAELLDLVDGERALEVVSRRQPPWLRRMRERLDCCGSNVDLDELVLEAGIHRRHLMRAFRRYVGCSIGEYLRRGRVRRAQRLLAETPTPLARVAVEAGFYDQSHFARVFRRTTGLKPREYRNLVQ